MGPQTLVPIWQFVAWSTNAMFQGTYPMQSLCGHPLPEQGPMYPGKTKLRLVELRGDWKYHQQIFRLKSFFNASNICHVCRASRHPNTTTPFVDFGRQPRWRQTVRSHKEFLLEQVGDPINAMIYIKGFHMSFLRFCSMHTINLGIGLFANGGAIFELMKVGHFEGTDLHSRFRAAFRSFKGFLRANGVECSQPVFKPWMFISTGTEYCFFASKVTYLNH